MASRLLVQNQPELPSLKNTQHNHDKVFMSATVLHRDSSFPRKEILCSGVMWETAVFMKVRESDK